MQPPYAVRATPARVSSRFVKPTGGGIMQLSNLNDVFEHGLKDLYKR